jgi:HK97 family phage portal protein
LLLEGGLAWQSMSLTPKDMDFLELKHGAAREIALAFGVPPMLLGIPGDNTYANYREANLAFWRQTVLPLGQRFASAFGAWLGPAWGEGLRLAIDVDQVEALSAEREALWRRVNEADFLTPDEKREAVGYGAAVRGGEAASIG